MDQAGQKGTGLWTVVTALEMGASVPTIYASLNGRVMSSMKAQRVKAEEVLNGPAISDIDLGSPADSMAPVMDAVVLSCIASYAQGMELLRIASSDNDYNLHMPSIAQIWKGGCIIRAKLLKRIQNAFNADPQLPNLMLDPWFADQVNRRLPGLAKVVSGAASVGVPVPCFSSTLDYINSYRTARLPQNLVQAMRDCFGSHTYKRTDKEGAFHTEWLQ
jgi:6-phosphogluconate dehydrogenase